jgi:hypothetical protein
MKGPLACPAITEYIKKTIESTGKCVFRQPYDSGMRCHFAEDPECGHYGEALGFDREMRREYYRCEFRKSLKVLKE